MSEGSAQAELAPPRSLSDISLWMFVTLPAAALLFALLRVHAMGVLLPLLSFVFIECGRNREARLPISLARMMAVATVAASVYCLVGFGWMYRTTLWTQLTMPQPEVSPFLYQLADLRIQASMAASCAIVFAVCLGPNMRIRTQVVLSVVLAAVVYPTFGRWTWGQGWLAQLNFHDFAGGVIIYALAAWAALGVMLGYRFAGRKWSTSSAALDKNLRPGVYLFALLLMACSLTLAVSMSLTEPEALTVSITVAFAQVFGAIAMAAISWPLFSRWRLHLVVGGWLAGHAAIAAAVMVPAVIPTMAMIGGAAALLLVAALWLLDQLSIKGDYVLLLAFGLGGSCGALAIGMSENEYHPLLAQVVGMVACFVWACGIMMLVTIVGLRLFGERQTTAAIATAEQGSES